MVGFTVVAMDMNNPNDPTITCTTDSGTVNPLGSAFAIGKSKVTCVAVDASGNSSATDACTFTVAVTGALTRF